MNSSAAPEPSGPNTPTTLSAPPKRPWAMRTAPNAAINAPMTKRAVDFWAGRSDR